MIEYILTNCCRHGPTKQSGTQGVAGSSLQTLAPSTGGCLYDS